jgi:ribonuclease HII
MEIFLTDRIEAGVDEVGRGCLAGPVVSAAVVLPKKLSDEFKESIKDSKKLTEKRRIKALELIKKEAIEYTIGFVNSDDIDTFNISKATFMSMHRALNELKTMPEHILVDGNIFDGWGDIDYDCIVKGDDKFYSIAAASIVAKVTRDEYMKELHKDHPAYGWDSNKGYGSKGHRDAIIDEGVTKFHRTTFLKNILQNIKKI